MVFILNNETAAHEMNTPGDKWLRVRGEFTAAKDHRSPLALPLNNDEIASMAIIGRDVEKETSGIRDLFITKKHTCAP